MNTLILIFYKIAAFFTRVLGNSKSKAPEKRAEQIADYCKSIYINAQSELKDISYGKTDLAFGGCGPVALYNALISLDVVPDFNDIVSYLEKHGAAFGGKLGTSPAALLRYLRKKGFSVSRCTSKQPEKLNEFGRNYDTFITVLFNDAKDLKKGLHFICTVKGSDNLYTCHNPLHTSDSLHNALSKCSLHPVRNVCTLGIKSAK